MPDAMLQYTDNSTLVSDTAVSDVAIDMAAVFHLSQEDFNDDIDDLSFIDLPQYTELPQGSELSVETSNCNQDINVAINAKSSLSAVNDVACEDHCLQLTKNNLTEKHGLTNVLQTVASTKRKRKFPGPAGVLPKLVRNYVINFSHTR